MFEKFEKNTISQSHGQLPDRLPVDCYAHAVEYLERGWSVIPLTGKRPAIRSWKEFQTRRASHSELKSWFGDKATGQRLNVGIVTGKVSGLIGIDCDSRDATEYWLNHYPKSPLIVVTGGGGAHVYYQLNAEQEVTNRVRVRGMSIDVRGEGGYLVAPPSIHATGRQYSWANWGAYRLDDVPLFKSEWLQANDKSSPTSVQPSRQVGDASAYIRTIVARSGERGHAATFRATCILRDAGLSEAEALAELIEWNATGKNTFPAWSTQELLHKVRSAYQQPNHE